MIALTSCEAGAAADIAVKIVANLGLGRLGVVFQRATTQDMITCRVQNPQLQPVVSPETLLGSRSVDPSDCHGFRWS